MDNKIWISRLHNAGSAVPFWENKPSEPRKKIYEHVIDPRSAPRARLDRGERLLPEELPTIFYLQSTDYDIKRNYNKPRFPRAFSSGYCFVNKEIADVMRDFDLADGALQPVTLFELDETTQVDAEYYLLHPASERPTIDVERSHGLRRDTNTKHEEYSTIFTKNPVFGENPVICLSSALAGTDFWVDKRFPYIFFMSDPLARALNKIRATTALKLSSLPVG